MSAGGTASPTDGPQRSTASRRSTTASARGGGVSEEPSDACDAEEAAFLAGVGRGVRARRLELGLTQDELAAQVGMTRNFLGGLERGKHSPNLLRLRRLAARLGVELPDLLAGTTPGAGMRPVRRRSG
jgi:ribosome-binding protein aMBF1 (putative translation factor)